MVRGEVDDVACPADAFREYRRRGTANGKSRRAKIREKMTTYKTNQRRLPHAAGKRLSLRPKRPIVCIAVV